MTKNKLKGSNLNNQREYCTYCDEITSQKFIYKTNKYNTNEIVIKKDKTSLGDSSFTVTNTEEIVLQCNGCERLHIYYIEDVPIYMEEGKPKKSKGFQPRHYSLPEKIKHKQPNWIKHINIDYLKLVGEIYSSYNNDNLILFSIGCRTLIDKILTDSLGDIGGFEKKLKEYKTSGNITNKQYNILKLLTEAGNASAHRAFEPEHDLAQVILDIIEYILNEMILSKKVDLHKSTIPAREKVQTSNKNEETNNLP